MSPKYLDPKRFEELGLTLAKYQTATDAEIKSKAILLKSANLLFSVSVNRHHMHITCIKMKKPDIPIEVRSIEDLLSLYDASPTEYEQASKLLKPPAFLNDSIASGNSSGSPSSSATTMET